MEEREEEELVVPERVKGKGPKFETRYKKIVEYAKVNGHYLKGRDLQELLGLSRANMKSLIKKFIDLGDYEDC